MRKIYSLVLMAAALLIGTNAWADPIKVGTHAELKAAIDDVAPGETVDIQLKNTISLDSAIQIYAKKDVTGKTVNLDLNGYNLEATSSFVIELYKGTLNVTGSGQIKSSWGSSSENVGRYAIYVCGYSDPNTTDWSNLTLGENVQVLETGENGTAITVDAIHANYGPACKTSGMLTDYDVVSYEFKSSTDPDYIATSVFRNGYIDYITSYQVYGTTADAKGWYTRSTAQDRAFGVNITVNGYVYGTKYGFKLNGTMRQTEGNIPNLTISSTAEVACHPTNSNATAIYASGYGNWTIKGYVHGNTGVYAKGGNVTIDGATVKSDNPTYVATEGKTAGVKTGGSAIVVESNKSYPGGQNVTIQGDAVVTGGGGYGVYEKVTTGDQGDIEAVVINGATVEGGSAGSIAVVTTSGQTQIYSGNVEGTITDENGDPAPISNYIPADKHTTPIYDNSGNLIGNVVSDGASGPTPKADFGAEDANTSVKWTGTSKELSINLKLTELEINNIDAQNKPVAQSLTIKSGNTLEVGKVILGPKAVVTIEPGAKLLVTGEEGIYSLFATNLVLQANATQQATFVIGPTVSSNRQPHATVQYTLLGYQVNASEWKWSRFSTPMCVTSAPTNNSATVAPTYVTGSSLSTYGKVMNEATESWEPIAHWSDFRPFHSGSLTTNASNAGDKYITYSFTGKLIGNVTDSIKRKPYKWNYYGNSFMAPMSTKALIAAVADQPIEGTVWFWDMEHQTYATFNMAVAEFAEEELLKIPALSFFVTRNQSSAAGEFNIDYAHTIFDYAVNPDALAYNAPARLANNSDKIKITMTAENGASDVVYLLGSDKYSAEYESGADAEKLMNNGLNVYVQGDMNYAMLATDELLGTTISMKANEAINYTMTFGKVNGEYALRDNMTGKTIAIVEGATYNFSAQPNEVAENRFEIVNRDAVTTDINTIVGDIASKAVYTVLGQYVGETANWNNLPAGIYVVDGVKVVK